MTNFDNTNIQMFELGYSGTQYEYIRAIEPDEEITYIIQAFYLILRNNVAFVLFPNVCKEISI